MYRTAYFQDFDGSNYKVTFSVGISNGIATIYNVRKIKNDKLPSAIAVVGSKPRGTLSLYNNITIPLSKRQARKSTKDLTEKYSSLNLNVDISESDGVPAIRLIDGSVLPLSTENGRRMYLIIAKLKFIKF